MFCNYALIFEIFQIIIIVYNLFCYLIVNLRSEIDRLSKGYQDVLRRLEHENTAPTAASSAAAAGNASKRPKSSGDLNSGANRGPAPGIQLQVLLVFIWQCYVLCYVVVLVCVDCTPIGGIAQYM